MKNILQKLIQTRRKIMKITLANGLTIEGTQEQITETLKTLGFSGLGTSTLYFSESRGAIQITEMNSIHLRNAILKYYGEWVKSLHDIKEPKEVVKKIIEGVDDVTWLAMVKELSKRKE